ncbi:MAG: FtsQ-type POTRA domain-containing protein [Sphingomonadales bacterium]|nr:FtsQ-type POTRA domain-containing protein [Sphingomonadales bacterium]
MKTATARKAPAKARKATPRKKVRQVSIMDRLLRILPFTEQDIQRVLTWGVLAVLLLVALIVANWFGVPQAAYQQYAQVAAKAGFEVKRVEITGMDRVDQLKVYDIVLAEKDRAMPLVDIDKIRADLIEYGWIKDVRVTRRLPDTLVVDILERKPTAVWQRGGVYSLIDDQGTELEKISAAEIGSYPVINGDGANQRVVALNKLLDRAQSLKDQIIGASWIGNRRWDLRFKTGETLALPEGDQLAAEALVNFTRMDGVHRLLGRDIIHFDLRDPERAYMRRAAKQKPQPVAQPVSNSDSEEQKEAGEAA